MCLKIIILLIIPFMKISANVILSRTDLGYSTGYFPHCPGWEKKAIITKRSLQHLAFTVQGSGTPLAARKKRYNYYQMAQLAKDPDIDFKKRTLVYVTGYLDSTNFPSSWLLGKTYKDLGYNVLLLDTNKFTTTYYPVACRYMKPVGLHAAEALANLTYYGLNPKTLEFVGISLGAHTMSFVAKNFKRITGINVSRLTGLDPAGPCFRNMGPEHRLDKTDGDFVEIIHTNIDGYGMSYPMGHINYYVNGGEFQIGDLYYIPCTLLCSHVRSLTIWHSALKHPAKFIALKCDSVNQARNRECYDRQPMETNYLGSHVDKEKQGIYFLSTDYKFPYYLGMNGTKKEFDAWTVLTGDFNKEDVIFI